MQKTMDKLWFKTMAIIGAGAIILVTAVGCDLSLTISEPNGQLVVNGTADVTQSDDDGVDEGWDGVTDDGYWDGVFECENIYEDCLSYGDDEAFCQEEQHMCEESLLEPGIDDAPTYGDDGFVEGDIEEPGDEEPGDDGVEDEPFIEDGDLPATCDDAYTECLDAGLDEEECAMEWEACHEEGVLFMEPENCDDEPAEA